MSPVAVVLADTHIPRRANAEIVCVSEEETVRRWLKRYLAEWVEGLRDAPHPGASRKVTAEYRERLIQAVRIRALVTPASGQSPRLGLLACAPLPALEFSVCSLLGGK